MHLVYFDRQIDSTVMETQKYIKIAKIALRSNTHRLTLTLMNNYDRLVTDEINSYINLLTSLLAILESAQYSIAIDFSEFIQIILIAIKNQTVYMYKAQHT